MAANPRAAAVAALVRQEQDGFSNLILDAELKRQKLEGRDKAFASAIFYTVLEHRGTLDYILEQFLPKGLAKLDAPVREILRSALAQARYMQVPVSAAVNEAVKLTRSFKKSSASGLVNAVLRRACTYDLDTAVFRDDIERLMVLGSAGRDVAEFLHKNYPDEARNILTYKADGGLTSLRANPLKADAAAHEDLLHAGKLTQVAQELGVGVLLDHHVLAERGPHAVAVAAHAVLGLLVARGPAEICRGAADVVNVAFKIGILGHFFRFFQKRFVAAGLNVAALVERQRAETAGPTAAAVARQTVFDFPKRRHTAVFFIAWVIGAHVWKRIDIIHLLLCQRTGRRILYNVALALIRLCHRLRIDGIGIFILNRKALRIRPLALPHLLE